jgi:hypothetical protein
MIRQEIGLYKVVIKTSEDYPKTFLTFFAIGEDNNEDELLVTKYTTDGKVKPVNGSVVGPISFERNVAKELFVHFDNKEKMRINIVVRRAK